MVFASAVAAGRTATRRAARTVTACGGAAAARVAGTRTSGATVRGCLGAGLAVASAVGLAAAGAPRPARAAEAPQRLAGKKAVVFGGTSGIGLAAARQLRDAGAEVLVVSRSGEVKAEGFDVSGLKVRRCDVQDRTALEQLLKDTAPFDILISSATGGGRAVGPFLTMDMDGYQASFAKLWGYANVVRYGAAHVRPGGCVVLVSGAPARRPKPGQVSLASVGAAVEQLARTVAPELAARGVRINVVSPGLISTPMFGAADGPARKELELKAAGHLIPRAGTADEVAAGVLFAVENGFVTGTTIDVDGGWVNAH